MGTDLNVALSDLQDGLRLLMLTWRDHRTGVIPIQKHHQKAFEDLLVGVSFGLADLRIDIMQLQSSQVGLIEQSRSEISESIALMRKVLTVLDASEPDTTKPVLRPTVLPNLVVFTGNYRPPAANDHLAGGTA